MSSTLRSIRVEDELWLKALNKAALEDRSVADVFRELVSSWVTSPAVEPEERAKQQKVREDLQAARSSVADCVVDLQEWRAKSEVLQRRLNVAAQQLDGFNV